MKDKSVFLPGRADNLRSRRDHKSTPEVLSITNAAEAHSQEMRGRMSKYALAMGIRMVCLVLLFVVHGWFKLIPIIGAVVLPWVAVMIANGGADISKQEETELIDQAPHFELPSAPLPTADPASEVLIGELIVDDEPATPSASTGQGDAHTEESGKGT